MPEAPYNSSENCRAAVRHPLPQSGIEKPAPACFLTNGQQHVDEWGEKHSIGNLNGKDCRNLVGAYAKLGDGGSGEARCLRIEVPGDEEKVHHGAGKRKGWWDSQRKQIPAYATFEARPPTGVGGGFSRHTDDNCGSEWPKHRDGKQRAPYTTRLVDGPSRLSTSENPAHPVQRKGNHKEEDDGPSRRPDRLIRIHSRHYPPD